MKKQKSFRLTILFIVTVLFTTNHLQAQVTMGSNQLPAAGALLDLTEGSTTTKGLGLPRVELTDLKPGSNTAFASSIGGSGNWVMTDHIGLLIYNIKENLCAGTPIFKAPYIWNGTEWQILYNPAVDVYTIEDSRDGSIYYARNFGSAGDWLLENIRYKDPAFTVHISGNGPMEFGMQIYAYPNGTDANEPATWDAKQGLLYSSEAAVPGTIYTYLNQGQGEANEGPATAVQGICPNGWHIPSDREWNDLEREIYTNASKYSSLSTSSFSPVWQSSWETGGYATRGASSADGHSTAMRSPCALQGSLTTDNGKSKPAAIGGFDILLVGYGGGWSGFEPETRYGTYAGFWSSSRHDGDAFWTRYFENNTAPVSRSSADQGQLHSVRCKKD
ncbi:FISUMP domain-containing protein [Dysgonomonas sp. 25]|uniref:FISUMP domain-containing protein n=1 Tax=Dysgonomonas sp. 25 TaxID=2302933 RepID=UPI0013D75E19|nr:FISUMP domain-containing protein [Dysgonomonas sp. 25]NDV70233.1 hypothetical protein [Dysgonomonas sp. 25]